MRVAVCHSIQQVFAPHIVSYLEKEEITLREELDEALIRESWLTDNCTEVQHVHSLFCLLSRIKILQNRHFD